MMNFIVCLVLFFTEVDERPPPYGSLRDVTEAPFNGSSMVTCRVCQALIDISGKKDQHVVKCAQCHEATVSTS